MSNLNIGKNRNICNDCKKRDKCIKCKLHIPKHPFKMCNFCTFKQVPIIGRLQYELLLISFTVFELAALVKSIQELNDKIEKLQNN